MNKQTFVLNAAAAMLIGAMAASASAQSSAQTSGGEPAISATMVPQTIKPGDADGAFITGAKFSEPDGEKMFRRVCAGCHMPDAKGVSTGAGFYPALAGNARLAAKEYPAMIVVKGLNGMPPVGGMMTDAQVADVVNYVRTHFGNKFKDKVTPEVVKALR